MPILPRQEILPTWCKQIGPEAGRIDRTAATAKVPLFSWNIAEMRGTEFLVPGLLYVPSDAVSDASLNVLQQRGPMEFEHKLEMP